jgi:hypothetical protein
MNVRRHAAALLLTSGTLLAQTAPARSVPKTPLDYYTAGKKVETTNAEAARRDYLAALTLDPQFAEAAYALAGLGHSAEADGYREARRLLALGLRTEAMTAIRKAAQSSDVPKNLLYLGGGSIGFWREVKDWMLDLGMPLAQMAGVLLLLCMLWRYFFGKPTVEIADFVDASITPAVGRNVTAMFREHLKRFATTYRPKLGLSNGPAQPFALPTQIATAIPATLGWLGGLPSLLVLVSPRRRITVSGFLHPGAENGAGLTILLTRNNRILYTSTLWQKDFDPAFDPAKAGVTAYYALAEPAAVWLSFRLARVIPS